MVKESDLIREKSLIISFCKSKNLLLYLEEDEYSFNDGIITTPSGKKAIIEVKVRNHKYSDVVKWGGAYLEQKKLLNLINISKEKGIKDILYINFFEDYIVIFKINDINPNNFFLKEGQNNNFYKKPTLKKFILLKNNNVHSIWNRK